MNRLESGEFPSQKQLYFKLNDDLNRFYTELRERLRSDVFLIDQGVRYLVKVRGKALRPFVVLASARLFGAPSDLTYRAAMIVELLHAATLIHDDVVDRAETRRSWPTFNRIWGNKYSVLFGDYLLAHSLIATLEKGNLEIVQLLADTARQMSQGQLKELAHARRFDMTVEKYLSMIRDKTASLFRTCAALGPLSLEREMSEVNALTEYGENLGMAFQIRDDVLDYTGKRSLLGKSTGADLLDRKITLPLLCALDITNGSIRTRVFEQVRNLEKHPKALSAIVSVVEEHNGADKAQAEAVRYAKQAIHALQVLEDKNNRTLLTDLAVFAVRRSK